MFNFNRWLEKKIGTIVSGAVAEQTSQKIKQELESVLQERADQLRSVTQALVDGDTKNCTHPSFGKWKERRRYAITDKEHGNLGEVVIMERICNQCGTIEQKKIQTNLLRD